jgi:hypothetical protein
MEAVFSEDYRGVSPSSSYFLSLAMCVKVTFGHGHVENAVM